MAPPPVLARHDFPDWDILVTVPMGEWASGLREVTLFKVVCPVQLDQVRQMWIWDNTFTDVSNGDAVLLYSNDAENMILEDRDYFRRAPNAAQDGFAYVPYVYPHPLVTD